MTEHVISVDDQGRLVFIYSDELVSLLQLPGQVETKRASHVEPTADGRWTADMSPSNGPVLGPFDLRGEALSAEVEWLKTNVLN